MSEVPVPLLAAGEPPPVALYNATGPSPFLLVTDHAGNRMPRALGRLGIAQAECERHIAWDIGIAGLGRLLADALGAMLIQQPAAGFGGVDPGNQRTYPDTRQRRRNRNR